MQWADDLDNAIAEFGQWVEAKISERADDVIEQERERVAAAHKAGNTTAKSMLNRERMKELAEEVWYFYVKRVVRRYIGDASGRTDGAYREKPATGDPRIDNDWTTDDVRYVSLGPSRRGNAGGRIGA